MAYRFAKTRTLTPGITNYVYLAPFFVLH